MKNRETSEVRAALAPRRKPVEETLNRHKTEDKPSQFVVYMRKEDRKRLKRYADDVETSMSKLVYEWVLRELDKRGY